MHSTLTDKRENLLNELGFVWDSHSSSWYEHFQTLAAWSLQKGHCNVPNSERSLSAWCKHQRREYRRFIKGMKSRITQERIDALTSIGFTWDPRNLAGLQS